jgi:hypothetical protein
MVILMSAGHANFLDVLVSELNIDDDDDGTVSPVQEHTIAVPNEPTKSDVKGEREEHDSEEYDDAEHDGEELEDEDTASDSWSEYDNSDDDDHALVRTVSGRPITTDVEVRAQERSNPKVMTQNVEDYFQLDHVKPIVFGVGQVLDPEEVQLHVEDDKKEAIVSVTVASAILTPPTSPDEINLGNTG